MFLPHILFKHSRTYFTWARWPDCFHKCYFCGRHARFTVNGRCQHVFSVHIHPVHICLQSTSRWELAVCGKTLRSVPGSQGSLIIETFLLLNDVRLLQVYGFPERFLYFLGFLAAMPASSWWRSGVAKQNQLPGGLLLD